MMGEQVVDQDDRRLIAALQCDGRVTTEQLARVLELSPRVVQRRLRSLLANGLRVVGQIPRARVPDVMLLRIRVLRGKVGAVAAALAARDDIPFVDISVGGDEVLAVLLGDGNRLVFRQLPATTAVTAVETQTVMHIYSDASQWRLDALTDAERAALQPEVHYTGRELDDIDQAILAALAEDLRLPAAAIAATIGQPESTVRRRLTALRDDGQFVTQTFMEPRNLGLAIDANLYLQIPPGLLERAGHHLARHPAVHGTLATTGAFNLHVAVWLQDLAHLYRFVTQDIADLGVIRAETVLIGRAIKRPGKW
jgi:DNA-binding Lrp family transcriptional regulator